MTKLPKRWDEYDGEPVEEVEPRQEGQPKQPEPDQQVHLHQTVSHKIVIMYLLYKYMYRTLSTNQVQKYKSHDVHKQLSICSNLDGLCGNVDFGALLEVMGKGSHLIRQ